MGTPYKLLKRKNPQDRQAPSKWYAVPKTGGPMDEDVMSQMATADTTMADFELEGAAKLISKWIYNQFMNGKRAKVEGLGTFRITFGSEGVDDILDFHTGLIRNIKISFIPDSNLRARVKQNITFEDAGVEEDGVYYGSLANYKEVKGLTGNGSGSTTTDEEDPDDGGSPGTV